MEDLTLAEATALVIDDEALMLHLASNALKQIGCQQVHTAQDGAAGLRIVESNPIDIAVCDLNMPGLDGLAVLRALAERGFTGAVVLYSGEGESVVSAAATVARAHGLRLLGAVKKPAEASDFAAVVNRRPALAAEPPSSHEITRHRLQEGLRKGEIQPHFQPQVDVHSGRVVGLEALARWPQPDGSFIPPSLFIDFAEEASLIGTLTARVYSESLAMLHRVNERWPDISISVNLSTLALQRPWLPGFLTDEAEALGVNPRNITLEVTESHLIHDMRNSLEALTRLRLKGFGLSIDDFGTGYASLMHLRMIPFTELKLDQSFADIVDDPVSQAILETSVALGRRLGLRLVSEGVENEQGVERMADLGCDAIQGWVYSKALGPDEALDWIEQHHDGDMPSQLGADPTGGIRGKGRFRVLVVDDSGFYRAALSRLMVGLGTDVSVATSAEEAMKLLSSLQFDLIVMDVQMPGRDGLEATSDIRRLYGSQPRIVGMSGNAEPSDVELARGVGMDDLMIKTLDPEVISAMIEGGRGESPLVDRSRSTDTADPSPGGSDQELQSSAFIFEVAGTEEGQLLVNQALDDLADGIDDLGSAARSGNRRACSDISHRLKSVAEAMGGHELTGLLRDIETAPGRITDESLFAMLARCQELTDELRATVLSELASRFTSEQMPAPRIGDRMPTENLDPTSGA